MPLRHAARSLTVAAVTAVVIGPLAAPGVAVSGGDNFQGSVGHYDFRDRLADHTGVTCRYHANGRLHTISVISPRVQPLPAYSHANLASYALWGARAQHQSHGHWRNVGGWHDTVPLKLPPRAAWKTLRPLSPIKLHAKVNNHYRLLERVQWLNHDTGQVKGTVVHSAGAYYYGPKTPVTTSCHDQRPTAESFGKAVLAGHTLTLPAPGVLKHATDADHDKLTLKVLSATQDGSPRSVVAHADGSFSVSTDPSDAGHKILVRYVAVDPAGVRSAPATFTITVTDEAPGTPGNVSVSNVAVTDHNGSGQPSGVAADLAWSQPSSGGVAQCYDVRAVIMISTDGGQSFTPDASTPQSLSCHSGTSLQNMALAPDNNAHINYVLWQVRARSITNKLSAWTTAASSPVPNEIGQPDPDAFQVLRYSGYWIDSNPPLTPPNCSLNDQVEDQSPKVGTFVAGTEVVLTAYGEVAC